MEAWRHARSNCEWIESQADTSCDWGTSAFFACRYSNWGWECSPYLQDCHDWRTAAAYCWNNSFDGFNECGAFNMDYWDEDQLVRWECQEAAVQCEEGWESGAAHIEDELRRREMDFVRIFDTCRYLWLRYQSCEPSPWPFPGVKTCVGEHEEYLDRCSDPGCELDDAMAQVNFWYGELDTWRRVLLPPVYNHCIEDINSTSDPTCQEILDDHRDEPYAQVSPWLLPL
jgi:hypothetical protein